MSSMLGVVNLHVEFSCGACHSVTSYDYGVKSEENEIPFVPRCNECNHNVGISRISVTHVRFIW